MAKTLIILNTQTSSLMGFMVLLLPHQHNNNLCHSLFLFHNFCICNNHPTPRTTWPWLCPHGRPPVPNKPWTTAPAAPSQAVALLQVVKLHVTTIPAPCSHTKSRPLCHHHCLSDTSCTASIAPVVVNTASKSRHHALPLQPWPTNTLQNQTSTCFLFLNQTWKNGAMRRLTATIDSAMKTELYGLPVWLNNDRVGGYVGEGWVIQFGILGFLSFDEIW